MAHVTDLFLRWRNVEEREDGKVGIEEFHQVASDLQFNLKDATDVFMRITRNLEDDTVNLEKLKNDSINQSVEIRENWERRRFDGNDLKTFFNKSFPEHGYFFNTINDIHSNLAEKLDISLPMPLDALTTDDRNKLVGPLLTRRICALEAMRSCDILKERLEAIQNNLKQHTWEIHRLEEERILKTDDVSRIIPEMQDPALVPKIIQIPKTESGASLPRGGPVPIQTSNTVNPPLTETTVSQRSTPLPNYPSIPEAGKSQISSPLQQANAVIPVPSDTTKAQRSPGLQPSGIGGPLPIPIDTENNGAFIPSPRVKGPHGVGNRVGSPTRNDHIPRVRSPQRNRGTAPFIPSGSAPRVREPKITMSQPHLPLSSSFSTRAGSLQKQKESTLHTSHLNTGHQRMDSPKKSSSNITETNHLATGSLTDRVLHSSNSTGRNLSPRHRGGKNVDVINSGVALEQPIKAMWELLFDEYSSMKELQDQAEKYRRLIVVLKNGLEDRKRKNDVQSFRDCPQEMNVPVEQSTFPKGIGRGLSTTRNDTKIPSSRPVPKSARGKPLPHSKVQARSVPPGGKKIQSNPNPQIEMIENEDATAIEAQLIEVRRALEETLNQITAKEQQVVVMESWMVQKKAEEAKTTLWHHPQIFDQIKGDPNVPLSPVPMQSQSNYSNAMASQSSTNQVTTRKEAPTTARREQNLKSQTSIPKSSMSPPNAQTRLQGPEVPTVAELAATIMKSQPTQDLNLSLGGFTPGLVDFFRQMPGQQPNGSQQTQQGKLTQTKSAGAGPKPKAKILPKSQSYGSRTQKTRTIRTGRSPPASPCTNHRGLALGKNLTSGEKNNSTPSNVTPAPSSGIQKPAPLPRDTQMRMWEECALKSGFTQELQSIYAAANGVIEGIDQKNRESIRTPEPNDNQQRDRTSAQPSPAMSWRLMQKSPEPSSRDHILNNVPTSTVIASSMLQVPDEESSGLDRETTDEIVETSLTPFEQHSVVLVPTDPPGRRLKELNLELENSGSERLITSQQFSREPPTRRPKDLELENSGSERLITSQLSGEPNTNTPTDLTSDARIRPTPQSDSFPMHMNPGGDFSMGIDGMGFAPVSSVGGSSPIVEMRDGEYRRDNKPGRKSPFSYARSKERQNSTWVRKK